MKIHNQLMPDMIIPDLKARSRDEAIREMVALIKKRNKIGREKELYEKLIQREDLGSTAISEGVAIPHCKIKGLKNPVILLAVSKEGVEFNSRDRKPTNIFFLVVSSPENPSLNLQILAAIAHIVRKGKGLKKNIMHAESIEEILEAVQREEEKLNG